MWQFGRDSLTLKITCLLLTKAYVIEAYQRLLKKFAQEYFRYLRRSSTSVDLAVCVMRATCVFVLTLSDLNCPSEINIL